MIIIIITAIILRIFTLDPPQLSSPIHNVTTVNVSDEVTLSCEGFGNPRPVIEWYFTGKGTS